MTMTYRGTTALITGASAGLGEEFAEEFAARGADVVLVARRADRLNDLAGRLRSEYGVTATPIAMDLATADAAASVRAAVVDRGLTIQTLINNAGFGMRGALLEADPERTAQMVQLNIATLTALTREFLPDLVSAGTGALVNIASVAAYQPCPNMAVYGATKAYVLSLTEALAYETRNSGLRVLAVSPGATATEFFDVAGGAPDAASGRFQTPQQVVARTLRELDRPNAPASFVSGRVNAITAKVAGILPRRLVLAAGGRVLR